MSMCSRSPTKPANRGQADPGKSKLLTSAPALRFWYVAINVTRGPLTDVRVRQALNYATDVSTIISTVMAGRGTVANGVIPAILGGYDANRKPYPHDVAKAKQLLAAAGHPNGIDVELWTATTDQSPRLSQAIQANLAEAGIRAKLVQRDASSVREAARKGAADSTSRSGGRTIRTPRIFYTHCSTARTRGRRQRVVLFESALRCARRSGTPRAGRSEAQFALHSGRFAAFDDAPMIYLFFYKDMYAVQPWLKGFTVPAVFNGQRWTDVTISK